MTPKSSVKLLLFLCLSIGLIACNQRKRQCKGIWNNSHCICNEGYFGENCDTAYSHRYVGVYIGNTILANDTNIPDTMYLDEEKPPYNITMHFASSSDTVFAKVASLVEIKQLTNRQVSDSIIGTAIVNVFSWPRITVTASIIKFRNDSIVNSYRFKGEK